MKDWIKIQDTLFVRVATITEINTSDASVTMSHGKTHSVYPGRDNDAMNARIGVMEVLSELTTPKA